MTWIRGMKVQSDCPRAGVSSNGTVVYSGNMDANSPPALILIDLQKAIDHSSWGQRNNPQAEANVARLLAAWRAARLPVYHVRHDSVEPASTYRPGQPGNEFKPEAAPVADEPVIVKHTNSAFIGTDLEARLRAAGHVAPGDRGRDHQQLRGSDGADGR